MKKSDIKFIGFRAEDELSEAAKKRAKEQHRSLAGYMRYLLEQDLGLNTLKEEPQYGNPANATAPNARRSSVSYRPKKTDRK